MVKYCSGSSVDGLQATRKLAPVDFLTSVVGGLKVPGRHVFEENLVGVPALELCLPHMMMSVNETRRDDLGGTVNGVYIVGLSDEVGDLCNLVSFDQHISLDSVDMVTGVVQENRSSL